jgi:hypothetical protein
VSYYGLIQLPQLNRPELSGFILEVVSPYTGVPSAHIPSGSDGQLLFKSGQYSAGSAFWFVSGKFGFGTTSPLYDFHLADKDLKARNGYFDDLFIYSSRVATTDEVSASGQFISQSISQLSGFLVSNYLTSGQTFSLYYPRTNPSGFVTTGQTGNFVTTGRTGTFITTGQTGAFSTTGWVNEYYYPRSNPSGFGAGGGGGTQHLSLNTGTHILSITSGSGASLGIYLTTGKADERYALSSSTGLFVSSGQTGDFVTTGQTGNYYPRSNPSGYIQSSSTGSFVTNGQTGNFVTTGQTSNYYPRSNPSGYVQSSATGDFITNSQTGQFQPIGSYVQTSQTGTYATTGWVHQYYYPRNNPSGYGAGGGGGGVGTGIGQTFEFNTYNLSSGQSFFGVAFTNAFPSTPVVVGSFQNLASSNSYSFSLSGISQTGFYLLLSDSLTEDSKFNYFATTGLGQFTIGATSTGSLVSRAETGVFAETGRERLISSSVSLGVNSYYVNFNPYFPTTPKVFPSLEITGSVYYYVTARESSISGYRAIFSDTITEDVILNSLAKI